jgi:hypothetical protein
LGGCRSNSRIVRSVLSSTWGLAVMDNLYALDGWPTERNQMGTVAQIHAIGQISLMYNMLQEGMELFFRLCMPTDRDFSVRLFHALNNRNRIDLVSAVIKSNEREEPVREALLNAYHCSLSPASLTTLPHSAT